MRISLIGMSGSGKSLWSGKLSDHGFKRFCCDEMIASRLSHELRKQDGTTMDLGEWMGFPYEKHYASRESQYLACERQVLAEIIERLERNGEGPGENVVVDTTGSVIYAGDDIVSKLRRLTTFVYFPVPPEVRAQMLKQYMAAPRPVLWRELFSKHPGETNEQALARCYPDLLRSRETLYQRYADVSIDYYQRHQEGFGVEELLHNIIATGPAKRNG
jgi:shikimate kinase